MKLFLFFSHKLTDEQIFDARKRLEVTDFVNLPSDLQIKFSQVPAEFEEDELLNYAKYFFEYLYKNAKSGDFALIQGDFGLTFLLVNFCLENGITPLYATIKRDVVINENGLKTSIFKHVKFRKYVI